MLVLANNVSNLENREISKFFSFYEGPYKILRKVGVATYLLIGDNNKERGRFHISNLKRYGRLDQTQIRPDIDNKNTQRGAGIPR